MPGEKRYVSIGDGETIAEVFARRVAATPDAIAYREFDGATWRERSWREVADATARVAAALRAEGPARDVPASVEIKDDAGEVVCRATITMWVSPRRKS